MKTKINYFLILGLVFTIFFLELNLINGSISQINDNIVSFEKIGQIDTPGMARHLVIRDNIAFVTDMGSMTSTYGGLFIYNVSDPTAPTELGHFYDGGRSHELLVEDNIAYVADNNGGLEIINITVLTNPVKIGDFNGVINGVEKRNELLYLSDYYDGLIIANVSNLTHPVEIARYPQIYHPLLRLIVNDFAYIAVETGLKVFNISIPTNISELANFNYDYHVYDLQIVGNVAYMACSRSVYEPGEGLKILNCTDPLNMSLIGSFYDGGRAIDLHLYESLVIIGDYNDGLEVINISDPFNPEEIGHFYDGGNATDIQVVNDLIYVADGVDGLEILRIKFPSSNPTKTPALTFHLMLTYLLVLMCIIRVFKKK